MVGYIVFAITAITSLWLIFRVFFCPRNKHQFETVRICPYKGSEQYALVKCEICGKKEFWPERFNKLFEQQHIEFIAKCRKELETTLKERLINE